jgi:hypothetical protein
MATRAEVNTVIETQNPDNTTALITPLATRTSQKAINDNSFNLTTDNSDNITQGATNLYITPTQASDITTNNSKISYTDAAAVALNTAKVGYADSLVNTFLTDGSVSSIVFGADTSLTWNATDFTLDMPLNGVTIQLGQETVARVLNNTGIAMTNGQVVIVSGASGNRLTAALADNTSDLTSGAILGIVTEPIANNQQGFATTEGLVRDLNTSSFTEGDVLYLGSSGGITNVKPVTPLHLVTVGYCVRSHATEGSIFAHPQNGYELDELHDVKITSAQDNDVLSWDNSNSYWKNVALPSFRAVGSEINTSIDLININPNTFYVVNALGSAITIDVNDTSNALYPIGSEFEFSPYDLTNDVTFIALGAQVIYSVDGFLKLNKPYSASILKKTASNTWLLIGTLKA